MKEVFTVGHSIHSDVAFENLLEAYEIKAIADVRLLPGSKRFPWFNSDELSANLSKRGIQYRHFAKLGGRRKPQKETRHPEWRNASFRAYADYMDTPAFEEALVELESWAEKQKTAIMCSEAVWWSCHRSLISDALKDRGWTVWHIMSSTKKQEHPYTQPRRQGLLF